MCINHGRKIFCRWGKLFYEWRDYMILRNFHGEKWRFFFCKTELLEKKNWKQKYLQFTFVFMYEMIIDTAFYHSRGNCCLTQSQMDHSRHHWHRATNFKFAIWSYAAINQYLVKKLEKKAFVKCAEVLNSACHMDSK